MMRHSSTDRPADGSVGDSRVTSLSVEDVTLRFGGVTALDGVSVSVYDDEILAIAGPNGAGKTSLINVMTGFYRPQHGRVRLAGEDVTGLAPHKIAGKGLARTFQNTNLFDDLSVLDNLMVGRHVRRRHSVLLSPLRPLELRASRPHRRRVEEVLDFLNLNEFRTAMIGDQPYGIRKRVDLGRALVMDPSVLLLDEPMAGMNREEKEDMARFILDVHEFARIPIILIEHDMELILDVSSRAVVLDWGSILAKGSAADVLARPEVLKAYLGIEGVEI